MPRYLVVAVVLLALPPAASSQTFAIDQGAIRIGGTISFTSAGGELYGFDRERVNSAILNPSALYFVLPGFAVGGGLRVENTSQGDFSTTTIGIGPEAIYYFGNPDSRLYPFVGAGIGYSSLNAEGFDNSGVYYGFEIGAAFMLSESVALTTQMDYSIHHQSVDQLDESFTGTIFGLSVGVAAFLF